MKKYILFIVLSLVTHSVFAQQAIVGELSPVYADGKVGFKDKTGRLIVPYKYDEIDRSFREIKSLASVILNGKKGLVNKITGEEILPCKYDRFGMFFKGFAEVKLNGKFGKINTSGKIIVPCIYDNAQGFYGGVAQVKLAPGKFGMVDTTGKEVIPCIYEGIESHSSCVMVAVALNDKWGFIDKRTWQLTIPCIYERLGAYWSSTEGEIEVHDEKGKPHIIDCSGKEIRRGRY